jgi:hypothetical protein
MSRKNPKKFVVLIDQANGGEASFLGETKAESFRRLRPDVQLDRYIGKGVSILVCQMTSRYSDPDEMQLSVNIDSKEYELDIVRFIAEFPIIEGDFHPGIYRFNDDDYYAIKDTVALSKVCARQIGGYYNSDHRIICRPAELEIRTPENEIVCRTTGKYEFTFFDLHCPICEQKIFTYRENNPFERHLCSIAGFHCPHYIGNSIWSEGGDSSSGSNSNADAGGKYADSIGLPYKFVEGDLYFKMDGTAAGSATAAATKGWRKVIVREPPATTDSIWNARQAAGEKYHFFFLPD